MKTTLTTALFILMATFTFAKDISPVHVISTKRDIFYFKTEKEFMDATIEVYNEKGTLVMTDTVKYSKTIIDFYNENPGVFIIKIKKGEVETQFEYLKKTSSPFIALDITPIVMAEGRP